MANLAVTRRNLLQIVYRRDCFAGSAARVNASVAQAVPAVEMN